MVKHNMSIFRLGFSQEKKLKSLRLIAMALGVAGSAVLLGSLLSDCCLFTSPTAGNISISLLDFMDIKVLNAFGLIEISMVFSLFNYAIPQILTGSFTGIWAGFMCHRIMRSYSETTEHLRASLGLGMYMFIISAGLILASGILFTCLAKKHKESGTDYRKPPTPKFLEVFCTIMMGISIVLFSVFELAKIRP